MAIGTLKLRKAAPESLRTLGLDESWLQQQISQDPSLLGFGDLHLIQREKIQPAGGRIDFLMSDPETETRYEIEVMLGAVDESHIIRTIEYWDVERQRYPTFEHRAVIVAEEITARFFNVIRLLNRAVPLVAIQLSAFRFDDDVVLQFTRVLDTYEFGGDSEDEEGAEAADKSYWENRSNPDSLKVVDAVRGLLSSPESARIVFNKHHIAMGTTGYNFCWFHPRREASHCHIDLKFGEKRQEVKDHLEKNGIEASSRGRSRLVLRLRVKDVQDQRAALVEAFRQAEEWSHR